ncbi:MAG: redoxin domain-containing protein [Rubripirellula sp.]
MAILPAKFYDGSDLAFFRTLANVVNQMFRLPLIAFLFLISISIFADDPPAKKPPAKAGQAKPAQPKDDPDNEPAGQLPAFELDEEVEDVLVPLFSSIVKAQVSRATVEMLADSLLSGTVVESKKSTYQIASSVDPDKFTIYLKEPEQRTRIYNDGESMAVALAPNAFFRIADPIGTQEAATNLPVPMGPYPEPLLALTLAGVDPQISLISGMKSLEIVDRKKFGGKVEAVHLRGVQADAVSWDLWISEEKQPKPLRLLIDMTPMLIASDQVNVPEGFSYQVRFDFLSWRVSGEVEDSLFVYKPAKDAKEFKSLEDYYGSIAGVAEEHPMIGKKAPRFRARRLDGKVFDSKDFAGKAVVLDFWATWCSPCVAALPIIKGVVKEFNARDVIFVALNTGEDKEEIEAFLKEHDLDLNVLLDPEGKIADAFFADAIPQTVLIGKTGAVESVHVGFAGEELLKQRLKDELDVLAIGGLIGSASGEATGQPSSKPPAKSEPRKQPPTTKSPAKKPAKK